MTDITKPKDLLELAAATFGISQEKFDNPKFRAKINLNFDDDESGLKLNKLGGTEFNAKDYKLDGDKKDILKGAELLGQQLMDKAEKLGMKITDFKEFKDADLNKDGKVDAKEVGALLLASSSLGAHPELGLTDTMISQFGELKSTFDNQLNQAEMKSLLDPKTAELVKGIAKKMLADNGVKIADAPDGPALAETARKSDVDQARC